MDGSVLDVGCGDAFLRSHVGEYIGIDIAGDPDIRTDLNDGSIPVKDESFDCVVCTDVLEHVDSLHALFDELWRCTRRYVIVSLPNCWPPVVKKSILMRKDGIKFYGLSPDRSLDRHKWFFNITETVDFISEVCGEGTLVVKEMEVYYGKLWKRAIGALLSPSAVLNNLVGEVLWVVLEKKGGG